MKRDVQLSLYRAESRASAAVERNLFRIVLLGLMVRRAWVLGRGVAGDAARRARWSA